MKKLLLLCAVLTGMFIFAGCGEQSGQASPTQAFNEWRNAIIAGKIDAANELTGKGSS